MSEIPSDLYYTADHEWVRRTGDDTVRVGITDYAQSALGDVVFVELPAVGTDVDRGQRVRQRGVDQVDSRICTRRSRRKSLPSTRIWQTAPELDQLRAVRRRLAHRPAGRRGDVWTRRSPDLLDADGYGATLDE